MATNSDSRGNEHSEGQEIDRQSHSVPISELFRVAYSQLDCSRAKYSGFRVGAALLSDGKIFPGCNVENSSYGLTICAERSAVMHWASAGSPGNPEAIVVVAKNSAGDLVTAMPCGACRQVLSDLPGSHLLQVYTGEGENMVKTTLAELLPMAFGPDDLSSYGGDH